MNNLLNILQRVDKTYRDFPDNWSSDLESHIEHDVCICKQEITRLINNKESIAFIDACSIIKLATFSNCDPIIKDICDKYGAIVITGEVVKELSYEMKENGVVTHASNWSSDQVTVVQCFAKYKKLLYVQEVDLYEHFLTHVGDRNLLEKRTLAFIKQITYEKRYVNKLTILGKEEASFIMDYVNIDNAAHGYTKELLEYLKGKKKEGDSLAELLILLIVNMFLVDDFIKTYFISEDRRADVVYQKVIGFQNKLRSNKVITEPKFMGRVELIYFVKSCVTNKTVTSDSEIIDCSKIYFGDNGAYKTTVSGGMYPEPEAVSLTQSQLLQHMRDPHYNFHSTSNRNIKVND